MPDILYNKPLNLSLIFSSRELERTHLGISISQHLELLIFTRFGEHRYRPEFGCAIWDMDFELIVNEKIWEEKFRVSLLESIGSFEKRLSNIEMDIKMTEVERVFSKTIEVKKQVDIKIDATIVNTGESFVFKTTLYLSPLSG